MLSTKFDFAELEIFPILSFTSLFNPNSLLFISFIAPAIAVWVPNSLGLNNKSNKFTSFTAASNSFLWSINFPCSSLNSLDLSISLCRTSVKAVVPVKAV